MSQNWEQALLAVARRELAQLEWLIECEQGGNEDVCRGDIHAQIDRLSGITDLAHSDGLPVSETTAIQLHQHNAQAMALIRDALGSKNGR
ncbi:hypothetical protein DM819_05975 [Pseudomonas hunanensis]|uniref:Flagellar protein FliT n=1 Tax=Pseudomonas hunanensis TaxID=1247546 RepID=A0ABD6MZ73_9PSED|nr:hypothetical protein [Pseudomonas hunanensis]NWL45430.1 hypothetical protein [Pseudomonas hunanensis]